MRPTFFSSDNIQQFNDNVLKDERTLVKRMLNENPQLICCRDSAGKTPLRIAFETDNYVIVKIIRRVFAKIIPNGRKMMADQFHEIFPEGYEYHCQQQKIDARVLLTKSGIMDDQYNFTFYDGISPDDIINFDFDIPNSHSPLSKKIEAFKILLDQYYLDHAFHNDEILNELCKIKLFTSQNELDKAGQNIMKCTRELLEDIIFFNTWAIFFVKIKGTIQGKEKDTSLFRLKNLAQGERMTFQEPTETFNFRYNGGDIRQIKLGTEACIAFNGSVCTKSDNGHIMMMIVGSNSNMVFNDKDKVAKMCLDFNYDNEDLNFADARNVPF